MIGVVVETHNRMYRVEVDGHLVLCQPKGEIRRNSNPDYRLPVIGDRVEVLHRKGKARGIEGLIVRVLGRKNQLARGLSGRPNQKKVMAANLDRVFVVSGYQKPGVNWRMIDRFLVYCELHRIEPILVMNKVDLRPDWAENPMIEHYRAMDYTVLGVSVKKPEGLEDLKSLAHGGISFLCGESGVGKSSIINALIPKSRLAVQEVSLKAGLGKHTTSNSLLIEWEEGSFLADSPGIREFLPPPEELDDLRFGFREFIEIQAECPFSTCLHIEEPNCAIRNAVENQIIPEARYVSYLTLVDEIRGLMDNLY